MVPLPSSIDFQGHRRNSKEPGRIGRAYETPESQAARFAFILLHFAIFCQYFACILKIHENVVFRDVWDGKITVGSCAARNV